MTRRIKSALIAAACLAVLAGGSAAIAGARGDDDGRPIAGSSLERARAAALARVGDGRVTDTEVGDEEGAYEVEVTRSDGSSVDVHLNRSFEVHDVSPDGTADHADVNGR